MPKINFELEVSIHHVNTEGSSHFSNKYVYMWLSSNIMRQKLAALGWQGAVLTWKD